MSTSVLFKFCKMKIQRKVFDGQDGLVSKSSQVPWKDI